MFDIIIQRSTKKTPQASHETYPYPPNHPFQTPKWIPLEEKKLNKATRSVSASTRNSNEYELDDRDADVR